MIVRTCKLTESIVSYERHDESADWNFQWESEDLWNSIAECEMSVKKWWWCLMNDWEHWWIRKWTILITHLSCDDEISYIKLV